MERERAGPTEARQERRQCNDGPTGFFLLLALGNLLLAIPTIGSLPWRERSLGWRAFFALWLIVVAVTFAGYSRLLRRKRERLDQDYSRLAVTAGLAAYALLVFLKGVSEIAVAALLGSGSGFGAGAFGAVALYRQIARARPSDDAARRENP